MTNRSDIELGVREKPPRVSQADDFRLALIEGFSAAQKTLPPRFFYDARGSALFEEITKLPEYYLTRVEIGILHDYAAEIVADPAPDMALIEFGSGSSAKTELLLEQRPANLRAYIPIDVSSEALEEATTRLRRRFPQLRVTPLVTDFQHIEMLDLPTGAAVRLGFFPGSTIGNFSPREACALLSAMRVALADGRLIVGVDLRKDVETLLRAYNDERGVTAAFNLNLLVRANREVGADFDLDAFAHKAIFNPRESRIEMHIQSLKDQTVVAAGWRWRFAEGETIHTENSYKYSIEQFQELAQEAGWATRRVWCDEAKLFSVHELVGR